jgi:hypothetical protein
MPAGAASASGSLSDKGTATARTMRHQSSITSLSWIPSEAVEGSTRVAFETGLAHYDPPPPDMLEDIEALRAADRFRFANILKAWVEVNDAGRITDCGYAGGGLPELKRKPERGPEDRRRETQRRKAPARG